MKDFVVIINFKTYPQATGEEAVKLAKECEQAAKTYGYDIRLAVQTTDIYRVTQATSLPVYAQHSDPIEPGRHTGFLTADAIKEAGARGALLNHSEHRMGMEDVIAGTILLQRQNMDAIVLVESVGKLRMLDKHIDPEFFGIEPPEMVGGDISVSTARPDLVKDAVHATSNAVIIGAGVKTYEDLKIAQELGARGVILASGIAKASHREKAFRRLLTQHGQ